MAKLANKGEKKKEGDGRRGNRKRIESNQDFFCCGLEKKLIVQTGQGDTMDIPSYREIKDSYHKQICFPEPRVTWNYVPYFFFLSYHFLVLLLLVWILALFLLFC